MLKIQNKYLNLHNYFNKLNSLDYDKKKIPIDTIFNDGYDEETNQYNCCFWLSLSYYLNNFPINKLQSICNYDDIHSMVDFNDIYHKKCIKKLCKIFNLTIKIYTVRIIDNNKYINPSCQYQIGSGKKFIHIAHYFKPIEHFELIKKNNKLINFNEYVLNNIPILNNKRLSQSSKQNKYHISINNKTICNKKKRIKKINEDIDLNQNNINKLCQKCLFFIQRYNI